MSAQIRTAYGTSAAETAGTGQTIAIVDAVMPLAISPTLDRVFQGYSVLPNQDLPGGSQLVDKGANALVRQETVLDQTDQAEGRSAWESNQGLD